MERCELLRGLPAIGILVSSAGLAQAASRHGISMVTEAARMVIDHLKDGIMSGQVTQIPRFEEICEMVKREVAALHRTSLIPVVNATGTVLHTNLGRALLPGEAIERMAEAARRFTNLEYDVDAGRRSRRGIYLEHCIRKLTGAEAALVVNNNAAAVFLAVNSLAPGKQVIVSRGEMVEIGGSFRIPDIVTAAGAHLVDVGTTNRTRLTDYESAITESTGLLVKVHPSNFRITGYVEETSIEELCALGRQKGLPVLHDVGSGLLGPAGGEVFRTEPTVCHSIESGADVVVFSGDKLLGGPQAGIVCGRQFAIDVMAKSPIYRAVRIDKIRIAALEAVLGEYLSGRAAETLPVLQMLGRRPESLLRAAKGLARAIRKACPGSDVSVKKGRSTPGGGSLPGIEMDTWVVTLSIPGMIPSAVASALRRGTPAVVARVASDAVIFDVRTLVGGDERRIVEALRAIAGGTP